MTVNRIKEWTDDEFRARLALENRRALALEAYDVFEAIHARRMAERDGAELPEPSGPLGIDG